ncbi:hypothetical protein COOONC_01552 [Cooperia oncophora]
MPTVVAALNYFCGPLTGVDKEIQDSLLQAVRRHSPPRQHRTKPSHMARLLGVKTNGNGEWLVHISRSRTDQCSKGAVLAFRFNAMEEALWNKYTATLGGSGGLPHKALTMELIKMMSCKLGAGERWEGSKNYVAPKPLPSSLPPAFN